MTEKGVTGLGKMANRIVKWRRIIIVLALILVAVCGLLSQKVPIITDMTTYLPPDSRMKQGMDIMAEEFPGMGYSTTIRVMFEDLPEEEEEAVLESLQGMENVSSAVVTGKKEEAGKRYTLFTLSTEYDYRSGEELAIEHGVPGLFPEYTVTVRNDDANGMEIPLYIYVVAVLILLAVLFVMCNSFMEPIVFLIAIGAAIVLNMGTNLILGSVSVTTYSISAILQLALSMDYSVILMNRYRQEKAKESDREMAMGRALKSAFSSIAGSGFTTVVGLLMLVFMRFRIGRDIGLVLAKGVFLSMVCCLTLLPALILLFDRLIEKTAKPSLRVPTRALAHFSFRSRYVLAVGFIVLFFAAWYMDSQCEISYSLTAEDPIADLFPKENPVVVLYENGDEEKIASIAEEIEGTDGVSSVYAWSTTLGRKLTADEMTEYLQGMTEGGAGAYAQMLGGMDEEIDLDGFGDFADMITPQNMAALYEMYALFSDDKGDEEKVSDDMVSGDRDSDDKVSDDRASDEKVSDDKGSDDKGGAEELSIADLLEFLGGQAENPLMRAAIGEEGAEMLGSASELVDFAKSQLVGPEHSLLDVNLTLPVEGEETMEFLSALDEKLAACGGEVYLIGNSPMNREMEEGFGREVLTITLLTAVSIFLVVLVTFRNLIIPAVLVLLVQCGVFLTVSTTWLMGYSMYYLALVIVQCILMGATVDYGILFTNYYREKRTDQDVRETLVEAYDGSMHTILTSSLFMIFATGAIGVSPADPTITQICLTISIGTCCAALLVIFVLPGVLAALDRFVAFPQRNHKKKE